MSASKQRIAITGIGESPIGKTPEYDSLDLHAQACREAVDDAGLGKDDIDGVLTAYSLVNPKMMHSTVLCDRLGLSPTYNDSVRIGGASPFAAVGHAASAIREGQCENVIVVFGDNRRTGWTDDEMNKLVTTVGHPEFENPFGPTIPTLYANVARKHMSEYGTTPRELAMVSVACRQHAAARGDGYLTDPITIDDVLSSEMIADPLHKFECALVTDGAGAVVVSGSGTAAKTPAPVELLGYGEGHESEYLFRQESLTTSRAVASGEKAFEMADLKPSDVDTAQLYDSFTITPMILLEDLGFCEKGEVGRFVREKGIEVGDSLPVNTHGGELAYAGAGIFHILEAVRQIRGDGGTTQVPDAETTLAHGTGGIFSTHVTLIFGRWE